MVVDCAEQSRLGGAASLVDRAGAVAVIDHHLTFDGFGDVAWTDPKAAATAQMVAALLDTLGWPVDRQVAEALYAGIVTDTGRFQYSSTTAELHRTTAGLLDAGVSPDRIGQHLFAEVPFGYLGLAATVLGRADARAGALARLVEPHRRRPHRRPGSDTSRRTVSST